MIKINIAKTVSGAFALTFKNIPSIFGCIFLWILTIWIPYINIGTTIAISNLPIALSKGEMMNPLSIFDAMYRRKMGDYIIYNFIAYGAILTGLLLGIFPGIILMFAWSMARFIMIEQDKNPMEALRLSNNITVGNKWRILFVKTLSFASFIILGAIFLQILYKLDFLLISYLGVIILFGFFIGLSKGVDAMIWKQLKESPMLD